VGVLCCLVLAGCSTEKLRIKAGTELGSSVVTDVIGGGFIMPEWLPAHNVEFSGGVKYTNERKTNVFLENSIRMPVERLKIQVINKFQYNKYFAWTIDEYLFFSRLQAVISRFDAALGLSFRTIVQNKSFQETIFEPFNVQYDVGVYIFPVENRVWNVRLGISNYDMFITERMEQFLLSLKSEYHVSEQIGVFASLFLRSAGNFNLSASYYSLYSHIGVRCIIF
jgi:hypothetical protein